MMDKSAVGAIDNGYHSVMVFLKDDKYLESRIKSIELLIFKIDYISLIRFNSTKSAVSNSIQSSNFSHQKSNKEVNIWIDRISAKGKITIRFSKLLQVPEVVLTYLNSNKKF
jgi:hypothetical protein